MTSKSEISARLLSGRRGPRFKSGQPDSKRLKTPGQGLTILRRPTPRKDWRGIFWLDFLGWSEQQLDATAVIVEATATCPLTTGRSALDAVVEVHDTAAEPVLLQQIQLDAGVAGERRLSSTDEHRINEELALIDQPGVQRMGSEGRAADSQIARGGCLHLVDRVGIEAALKPVLVVETPGIVVE